MGGGPYYVPQLRDYGGFSPDAGRGGGVGKGLRISPRIRGIPHVREIWNFAPHSRENSEFGIRKLESGPPSSRGCGTTKGALKGRGARRGRRRRVGTISNDVPTGHE